MLGIIFRNKYHLFYLTLDLVRQKVKVRKKTRHKQAGRLRPSVRIFYWEPAISFIDIRFGLPKRATPTISSTHLAPWIAIRQEFQFGTRGPYFPNRIGSIRRSLLFIRWLSRFEFDYGSVQNRYTDGSVGPKHVPQINLGLPTGKKRSTWLLPKITSPPNYCESHTTWIFGSF